jgi:hypothetical protein
VWASDYNCLTSDADFTHTICVILRNLFKTIVWPGLVHTNYSGGRDQENHSFMSAVQKERETLV